MDILSMDDIKMRVWDKSEECMHYSYYDDDANYEREFYPFAFGIGYKRWNKEDMIIMYSTNVPDINKKEIYAYDIVGIDTGTYYAKGVVQLIHGTYYIVCKEHRLKGSKYVLENILFPLHEAKINPNIKFEVLGNVFENKDIEV